jgi:hypothetical protein
MLTDARIAELMGWSANPAHVTGVLGGGPKRADDGRTILQAHMREFGGWLESVYGK